MTPETYMKRYHGSDPASCPLTAEALYPCRPDPDPCLDEDHKHGHCPCRDHDHDDCHDHDHDDCHDHDEPDEDCCCKASMLAALRLLCSTDLSDLVDFERFFFLTDALTIGATLRTPTQTSAPADNINEPDAAFRRFSPCNNDLLEVDGTAYFASPVAATVALADVDQISVCALKAVAFQLIGRDEEDENEADFRRAVRILRRELGCQDIGCGTCEAHCDDDECCCVEGILHELSRRNLSRTATLTAGQLVLENVTVLGSIGSVLVLANPNLRRFYLICAVSVETLG